MTGKYMYRDPILPKVSEGLSRIRRRKIFALGAMLCAPVILAVASTISPEIFPYVALVTLGFMIVPVAYWSFSTCPRCAQLFYCSWYWSGFSSKCVNCDVPLDGRIKMSDDD